MQYCCAVLLDVGQAFARYRLMVQSIKLANTSHMSTLRSWSHTFMNVTSKATKAEAFLAWKISGCRRPAVQCAGPDMVRVVHSQCVCGKRHNNSNICETNDMKNCTAREEFFCVYVKIPSIVEVPSKFNETYFADEFVFDKSKFPFGKDFN